MKPILKKDFENFKAEAKNTLEPEELFNEVCKWADSNHKALKESDDSEEVVRLLAELHSSHRSNLKAEMIIMITRVVLSVVMLILAMFWLPVAFFALYVVLFLIKTLLGNTTIMFNNKLKKRDDS